MTDGEGDREARRALRANELRRRKRQGRSVGMEGKEPGAVAEGGRGAPFAAPAATALARWAQHVESSGACASERCRRPRSRSLRAVVPACRSVVAGNWQGIYLSSGAPNRWRQADPTATEI